MSGDSPDRSYGNPQIPQISQIIFSANLRHLRNLRINPPRDLVIQADSIGLPIYNEIKERIGIRVRADGEGEA